MTRIDAQPACAAYLDALSLAQSHHAARRQPPKLPVSHWRRPVRAPGPHPQPGVRVVAPIGWRKHTWHTTAESPTNRRRDIASELDNLTIADPTVNRSQKGAQDAAEWMPTRHGAWFAERVIQVKLEYELTVDTAERNALEALLAGGGAQLNCVD